MNITEEDHQELLLYLETLIGQMSEWVATKCKKGDSLYDKFMSYPYMKLVNDTFPDLISDDALEFSAKMKGGDIYKSTK